MAAQPRLPTDGVLRVLDPGAGIGMLTAALVCRVLREQQGIGLDLTAVEIDPTLHAPLRRTLDDCQRVAHEHGLVLTYRIIGEDFVRWAASRLMPAPGLLDDDTGPAEFDIVIQNPPYSKLGRSAAARKALLGIDIDVPNIYAAFMALGARLLVDGGQLVSITPRSFANGAYFLRFRQQLFAMLGIDRLMVFEERGALFSDLAVLQENLVMAGTRGRRSDKVIVSSVRWNGDSSFERPVAADEVVSPADPNAFLHIPTDADDDSVADLVSALPASLQDLGLSVSTGRVVDFRAKWALRDMPGEGTVPLIYPGHLERGRVRWPLPGYKKPNALAVDTVTSRLLLPAGFYVLVKRLTAKEETRRIVAAVFRPKDVPCDSVGFENHLNVFHHNGHGLDEVTATGLALWLNSTVVDLHFRRFSGHTQVNATDLRSLRYPDLGQLRRLGSSLNSEGWPDQDRIDSLVETHILGEAGTKMSGTEATDDPVASSVEAARLLLKVLGFDNERSNERSALVLRALLGLRPEQPWAEASSPLLRTVEIMDFLRQHYGRDYKPNTRETIRRQTLHQFADQGLVIQNPDRPDRPINSPHWCYQISDRALALIRSYGELEFDGLLVGYLTDLPGQLATYSAHRAAHRVPVTLPEGRKISLSPGGQNELLREMIEGFCSYFTPGGIVLYVGDADDKWQFFEEEALRQLGVTVDRHGKMPDLVVYMPDK
ncbi:MAG: Eco57I restriction-modification methylase domain-containing protein, partial [Frankia sp.]|nr:Eco57I restriction-modification methylase domain-containing protein [Frankia sp.]